METVRLNLPQVLALRSDSVNPTSIDPKDSFLRNCYKEQTPIGEMIVKRPGLVVNTFLPEGCAQGSFVYNGTPYFIANQTIYGILTQNSPIGGGSSSGGGGGVPAGEGWEELGSITSIGYSKGFASYAGSLYSINVLTGSNRVYRSTDDGVTWTLLALDSDIVTTATCRQSLAVHNNALVVLLFDQGGKVCSSTDGISWTVLTSSPFGILPNYEVMGMISNGVYLYALLESYNEAAAKIWRSPDGVTWTEMNSGIATIPAGLYKSVFVGDASGNLYIIGGYTTTFPTTYQDSVWRSTDGGVTWTTLTSSAAFGVISGGVAWNVSDTLYFAGGYNGSTYSDDVYISTDGITWTLATATPGFEAFADSAGCVHNGQLFIGPRAGASTFRSFWHTQEDVSITPISW